VKHIRDSIEELRRYIAENDAHHVLEEVDTLLSVAFEDVRRKLVAAQRHGKSTSLSEQK
jgi:hypothetical protein